MTLIPGGKSGKVGKISVKPGDKVDFGDILAQVETGKAKRSFFEGVYRCLWGYSYSVY